MNCLSAIDDDGRVRLKNVDIRRRLKYESSLNQCAGDLGGRKVHHKVLYIKEYHSSV